MTNYSKDQLLLVEGENDKHVIWSLLKPSTIPPVFEVREAKNLEGLLSLVPIELKGEHLGTLGIVVDADQDSRKRWTQVRSIFENAGFQIPKEIPKEGWIGDSDGTRAGAWLMPDNSLPGMLEDFVSLLIDKNDALRDEVTEALNLIEGKKLNRYKKIHRQKAFIHTWLAWQKGPGKPMGQAITAKYLKADSPSAQPFLNWIEKLFVDGEDKT